MKPLSDLEHQKVYSDAVAEARLKGPDTFQGWFDKTGSVHEASVRGHWDFAFHILKKSVYRHVDAPHEKTALEIGYGGGRILGAACGFFKHVVGIDIHNERDAVKEFLSTQGKKNFTLLRTNGDTLDVGDESIDFVYSFIVLQHLPRFEVLESYVREIARVLKQGGLSQLYFGRLPGRKPKQWLEYLFRGYSEITDAQVNCRSLAVIPWRMKLLCRKYGLRVLESGSSYKQMPDGYPKRRGGQHYVTVIKQQQNLLA